MTDPLLLIHAAATWFMTGLIWFVQVVHYPLFSGVGAERWLEYEARHKTRTTWVVLPVMLVELVTAAMLASGLGGEAVPRNLAWTGAALLAIVWIATFAVQVPLHARLGRQHSPGAIRMLVRRNWIRTIAWSARGLVALALLG